MKKTLPMLAGGLILLAASSVGAAQTTAVQFEPSPCVVSLNSSYTTGAVAGLNVELPASAITCPDGFTYVPGLDGITNATLANGTGQTGPRIENASVQYFDQTANAIMARSFLSLLGSNSYGSPNTFDRLQISQSPAYVTQTSSDKNYRLVLASPVTVTSSVGASPTCKINLGRNMTWKWGQANSWVIPDSAVTCTGTPFSSQTMSMYVPLKSRQQNQGFIMSQWVVNYDPASGQYTNRRELHLYTETLSSYDQLLQLEFGFGFGGGMLFSENQTSGGAAGNRPPVSPVWGKFSLGNTGGWLIPPFIYPNPYMPPANMVAQVPSFKIAMVPVTIKRVTTVKVTSKRAGADALRLSITADRNTSFNNTTAPTYRRQTVLPGTPADHAVVKRGNTVLKRVKLSPYGTATVTIPDAPGRNRYSVTMVATNDNFQGRAFVTG